MANWIVACTISTLAMLGSTWSQVMRQRALAGGARRQHVLARPDRIGRGARDAREHRDVEDADRDDARSPARARRSRVSMIADSSAGNAKVKSARRITASSTQPRRADGEQAERDAEDEADADRDHADQRSSLRADEQQRGDVAAEAVGAEPVRRARRLQLVRDVDLGRRIRRPHQRQQRRPISSSSDSTRADRRSSGGAARARRSARRRRAHDRRRSSRVRSCVAGLAAAGRSPHTARRPRS